MAAKKLEIIYSQQSTDFAKDKAYANPRFFTSPRADATKVFIVGDWPKIVEAYEARGVPVERIDAQAALSPAVNPMKITPPETLTGLAPDERRLVEIPEDWATVSWQKMRGIASKVSEAPVLNKDMAVTAIEAELARRDADQ